MRRNHILPCIQSWLGDIRKLLHEFEGTRPAVPNHVAYLIATPQISVIQSKIPAVSPECSEAEHGFSPPLQRLGYENAAQRLLKTVLP